MVGGGGSSKFKAIAARRHLDNNKWANVFTGNMTHLWIEGFERYLSYDNFTETHLIQAQILGSNSLDVSQNPLDSQRAPHVDAFLVL
jgi:hypothetical protein